jgi:glycosyltransferase involved in cell wall biosynthesis
MSHISENKYMHNKLPLSISLITKNEEKRLARTLKSIADIASEIIIVDSGSTDNTQFIANQYNANFSYNQWNGFSEQKNCSLNKCTQKWILCLDADEEVTEKLKQSIIKVIEEDKNFCWMFNRKTFYAGEILNHSWQPDKKLRLVKKEQSPLWTGGLVHEELKANAPIKQLDGDVIHFSYFDVFHHFHKTIEYSKLSAQNYYVKGKRFTILKFIINPILAFFKSYFIKRAFLEGIRGIAVSFSYMTNTFLKYLFLWEIENKK